DLDRADRDRRDDLPAGVADRDTHTDDVGVALAVVGGPASVADGGQLDLEGVPVGDGRRGVPLERDVRQQPLAVRSRQVREDHLAHRARVHRDRVAHPGGQLHRRVGGAVDLVDVDDLVTGELGEVDGVPGPALEVAEQAAGEL